MRLAGSHVVTDAGGVADVGGTFLLVYGPTAGGPWASLASADWGESYDWGEVAGYEASYLTSRENGNGTVYSGPSEYAVALPPRV